MHKDIICSPLPRRFYLRKDVCEVARDLLGRRLCTYIDGQYTCGRIVETEAYAGQNDRACHANDGKRTPRTEVMYHKGGVAYVYLCYGIHHMFNVVVHKAEMAGAVLVRAIEPGRGVEYMLARRGMDRVQPRLTAGPGTLSQALGIDYRRHYGADLQGPEVWIETGQAVQAHKVITGPRVGVDYAGDHALRPWRYALKGNRWVSRPRVG